MADELIIVIEDESENVYLVIEPPEEIAFVLEEGVGPRGFSAYEIALQNGFVGTEQEWLDSLNSDITIGPTEPENPYLNQLWIQTT